MTIYKAVFSTRATPQSEPIPGSAQVPNNAGGYSWRLDEWRRLARFLTIGSEGGTYYVGERKLTIDNAQNVIACIQADGPRTVALIRELSITGRAPKQSPALFALALCAVASDSKTRFLACSILPEVARTASHLFEFVSYVTEHRGWGRLLRAAVANWYDGMDLETLSYQLVKYRERNGWSHRDLLRLAHPKTTNRELNILYAWAVRGFQPGEIVLESAATERLYGFDLLQKVANASQAAGMIQHYRLPREAVPTQLLKEPAVWEALLENMPITAMIRNLGTMSKIGLLTSMSNAERLVAERLQDIDRLIGGRVHPINLLAALRVYQQGHGERSDATWQPCRKVVDALDTAFYLAFKAIQPSGKRILLALDCSGSMEYQGIAGMPGLTPRQVAAAMALVTANTEQWWEIIGFTTKPYQFTVSPRQRLDDVLKSMPTIGEGTNCAIPMELAEKHRLPIDAFVLYTDSETWYGREHPAQALNNYRQQMGIPAKLVVISMTANDCTIGDPEDAGTLNVAGFDAGCPQLISDFVKE